MNNALAHLTVTQAAHLLGVHRRTVDRLLANGNLQKDGRTLTIPRAQVIMVNLKRQGTPLSDSDYQCIKDALIARLMNERSPDSPPAAALAS